MRKDAGTYGDAQRLEQMAWLFFLKILDDREKEISELRDNFRSSIPKYLRWSAWATNPEGITGEALLEFVNNTLLPRLQSLPGSGDKISSLVRMTFADANNYMKNGTLLRQVINAINAIDFNASEDRHLFGDIYERLLKDLQSAGNAGEFYTPRAVTQFIVEQINPRLGEKVLDPACGTGGFLTCAIDHLRRQAKNEFDEKSIQECFHGIEKKHLPHVLCMTNLMLHGIDVPSNVKHDNTLARPLRDWGPQERVDCVITNPPFGGMEEDGIEANFPSEFRTRETADMFLVLIIKLLKPGGRAGIILPDGGLFFSTDGIKSRIKQHLMTECNLHTIIRLPEGVFSPYTNIRTNLLFFAKGQPTKKIWYYEHPYPVGAKTYNKGSPIRFEEFEPEKTWWGEGETGISQREPNSQAWCVEIEKIASSGFNLDHPNPLSKKSLKASVKQILDDRDQLLSQIAKTRNAIKSEIFTALSSRNGDAS